MKNIFAVNKPRGMKSHDVVDLVRKKTNIKRVGHGGTLDPLAQGVLVIAVGRENTKRLEQFVKGEKEYVAQVMLGFESATDDEEGEKTEINRKIKPTLEEIQTTVSLFIGMVKQTPPIYSAIKLKGKPAYKYARKALQTGSDPAGSDPAKTIILKSRPVEIKDIQILSYDYPILKIRTITGPGVYIRSLARDIGRELKTGAYLKNLIRTRVANFTIETATKIEDLKS